MFTNIMLAVDGSQASLRAARQGIELARSLHAKTTVITVTLPWAAFFSRELAVIVPDIVVPKIEYDQKRDARASRVLQDAVADARAAGVPVTTLHRCHADPYQAIVDAAAQEHCDLIVMGSHCPRGFTGALLGSETVKVLTRSSVPVLVYRED